MKNIPIVTKNRGMPVHLAKCRFVRCKDPLSYALFAYENGSFLQSCTTLQNA